MRKYWLTGPGAIKIRWGTDGDWTRCVRKVGEAAAGEMTPEQVKGFCSNLHRAANGFWPGDKKNR